MIKNMAYQVNWTEYERGWGSRPDGSTLHKDEATANKFIDDFYYKQENRFVPDEYDRPGEPFITEINEEIEEALESSGSIWIKFSGCGWKLGMGYCIPPKQGLRNMRWY
jgi:hypothetical protein